MKQILKNIISFIYTIIYVLIEQFYKSILYINNWIKYISWYTKYQKLTYFWIYTFIIIFSLSLYFKHDINIEYQRYTINVEKKEATKLAWFVTNEEHKVADNMKNIFNDIDILVKNKIDLCIKNELIEYKTNMLNKNIIVNEDMINIYKLEIETYKCNISSFDDETLVNLIEVPLKEQIKQYVDKKKSEEESVIKNNEVKIHENEQEYNTNIIISWSNQISKFKDSKNDKEIKAIICVSGHWKTNKEGKNWRDPGAIIPLNDTIKNSVINYMDYNMLNNAWKEVNVKDTIIKNNQIDERFLIRHIAWIACDKIEEYAKNKNIKVFRLWLYDNTALSLNEKIKTIKLISEENWLNENNSLLFDLHLNKVSDIKKSGIEVRYSQNQEKGQEFAWRVLYWLNLVHNFGNHYYTKNDARSRFKWLWILSGNGKEKYDTPLSILIEYWFISNENDTKFIIENRQKSAESIANAIIHYIK